MGAEAYTSPIGGLAGVGERIALFDQRGQEFVDQMWMRATMTGALGETEMRLLC